MGESKAGCLLCGARPHAPECPKSMESIRALQADCESRGSGRMIWGKGPLILSIPGKSRRIVTNPGVPFVNVTPGEKTWKAGGVPAKCPDEVREFAAAMAEATKAAQHKETA